jgi:hypothetical protein
VSRFLDALPSLVIDEQLERLQRAFPGRRGDLDGFAGELRRATEGWTVEEFVAAIDAVVRSENSFPRIAKILKHRPERLQGQAIERSGSACFRCGVEPYLAGYSAPQGVIGRYRCGCAGFDKGGWATPEAIAWTEGVNRAA